MVIIGSNKSDNLVHRLTWAARHISVYVHCNDYYCSLNIHPLDGFDRQCSASGRRWEEGFITDFESAVLKCQILCSKKLQKGNHRKRAYVVGQAQPKLQTLGFPGVHHADSGSGPDAADPGPGVVLRRPDLLLLHRALQDLPEDDESS